MKDSKKASLEGFLVSKSKERVSLDPTVGGRVLPMEEELSLNLLLTVPFVPLILKMSHEQYQNGNHNEGPSDPLMQEVVGILRSLQQQMGNIERNVGSLRRFHNVDNLTPRQTMRDEDSSPHANFGEFGRIKLKIPPFQGKSDPKHTLNREKGGAYV
ncbi:hypothetical protein M9H77_02916 [Catharanthus roseus]|uniref:Uncharacterized protein n=1 Tax=Catharanthus roseus TaxID=4058 RepID=A0ACC0CA94_CATRO|nr:hypothetical protein M9H77_02916 [Catharanthus roseus]